MRAVNLLPADLRRAGSGGGSGSGLGAYILLGALAACVLIVATWAISARQVKDRTADVAHLTAEAQSAEAEASSLSSYEATVKVADQRRKSVVDLANGRFNWGSALTEVSRTVPDGASVTSMNATTAPGVASEGGGSALRGENGAPAIELEGCASSQAGLASLMARLRGMKGVTDVGLSTAEKAEGAAGGAAASSSSASGSGGDCTAGSDQRPKFSLVVFYGSSPAAGTAAAGTPATATATAGAATTKPSTSSSTTTTPSTSSAPTTPSTPSTGSAQ